MMNKISKLANKFVKIIKEGQAAVPAENVAKEFASQDIELINGTTKALDRLKGIYSKLKLTPEFVNQYDKYFTSTTVSDADKAKYAKQINEDIKHDFQVLGIR
jgi:hypothetical protein